MKQILILTWFLFASANSQASTCEAAVAGNQHNVVLRQIQQLNPELSIAVREERDWARLYVLLKTEEWKFARASLSEAQKHWVIEHQSAHYDFKDFGDVHFRQFYINALRSLYVRVAAFWAEGELVRINGGELHPDVERIALRVLEGTQSPWTLKDRDLTPESAQEYFATQPWLELPWKNIFAFIEAWKKSSPYEFSHDKFSKFWTENSEKFGLGFDLFSKLQLAASGREASLFCCLSEPGCVNCPHNRRWLK